jgi:hypothetical protein
MGMRVMVITIVFPGITETIFWSAAKTKAATLRQKGERWTFANGGLLFDLQQR